MLDFPPAMKNKIPYILAASFLGLLALYLLVGKEQEPPPLEFTDLQGVPIFSPSVPVPQVTLTDQNGQPFNTGALKNGWSLMFFGFTNCPDICPTTLNVMAKVKARLNLPAVDHTRYYFVTLDPKRDSPEVLKKYVGYFDPGFIGLTGDKEAIDKLSQALGIVYDYEGDIDGDNYTVNHYSAILVIDPKARVRAHILPPHTSGRIEQAYTRIRGHYQ